MTETVTKPNGGQLSVVQQLKNAHHDDVGLEARMIALCAAGKPRVCYMGDGWACMIDMHVAAAGTEFKVRSEYTCISPLAAVLQCQERVINTLKQWE